MRISAQQCAVNTYMISEEMFCHYITGIQKLDTEHWEILKQINEFIKLASSDFDQIDLSHRIAEIRNSLMRHFAYEESLMKSIDYPYAAYHASEHQLLLFEFGELAEYIIGPFFSDYRLKDFQRKIMSHIDFADMQIASYISKKTVDQS